jgi:Ca-activated chloride channel homolog
MSMTIAAPGTLWLLGLVPLVWLALRFGRTNFGRRQRVLQASVRSALIAILALALSRPVISTDSSRQSIVYVVDVSHSIATAALGDAAAKIDRLNADLKPDASRILVFGAKTVILPDTAALRALAAAAPGTDDDRIGRSGSDLELALSEARAELRVGDLSRIVLFSDGRETGGDVHAATLRLAADGVPVFVEPLAVRDLGDAWVDSIDVPDLVPAGTTVPVTVVIGSQREAADATIEVRTGSRTGGTRRTALTVGTTEVPIDVTFGTEGSHVIEVRLTTAGDPLVANNRLSREVVVRPRARVLYVESSAPSARYLQNALSQAGFDVTVQPPTAVPATVEELDPWDVVILSDVGRASIPDASMAALVTWVEQEGGGLFVSGGELVFGESKPGAADGYRRTELERLLPVSFERKDQPDVGLVIVLDKSWSMNGRVMELCKAAAQAAVDALTDRQTLGVLTFDDRYAWDVTPRNVGEHREEIKKAIANIQPGGDTLIYPALEQAYLVLNKVKASAKHVVLLSDGRSYPDDYAGLVRKMVDVNMTVSAIAVGPAADTELLTNIAKWGKGRSYIVQDAKEVAQIFVKEAKSAMSAFDEGEAITPVVKTKSLLSAVDLTSMPDLRGRTAMVLKELGIEVLATKKDDPLLAFWPFGLGRTAVFASDVKDRWASAWLSWKGYGPFFAAVVRGIERQRQDPLTLEVTPGVVRGEARSISVVVEARDSHGRYRDLLRPVVHVRSEDGASADVTARQVAPGRYEASMIADADQPLTVTVASQPESVTLSRSRHVVPDLDGEYRLRPTDEDTLRAIASATGGVFSPTVEDLKRPAGSSQTSRRALWPALVAIALGLWMVDIFFRRIRMFDKGLGLTA